MPLAEKTCWHCGSPRSVVGTCDCAICAPYPVSSAPCEACLGIRKPMPMSDPRDLRNWILVAAQAPARHYRKLREFSK
jgi:hypothetical protein